MIRKTSLGALSLVAVGVVYGDIGTSPLYAIRECFFGPHGVPVTTPNVLGVLSLILWSLIIIVTIKYHVYVLHADNEGEGGILALMALARSHLSARGKTWLLVGLGLFGAALLYGDGMITPAISVLGALEGLEVATKVFNPLVVPLTIGILIGLFFFQKRGTAGVGKVFGPVMIVWFLVLSILGVKGIIGNPHVLAAINPAHAIHFFGRNGFAGFLVLGAVFLVATGGEALYADLGHFGETPIQIDWFGIVLPSLLLNYFGQGALLIAHPAAAHNPFYRLAPEWALYPLVVLATAATVIASQAVISGVFSLTRQAIQLGFLPRLEIVHTSASEIGQIYLPAANWILMGATIVLVIMFRSSTNLAAAYGIAVTTTMVITTLLAFVVTRRVWHWPLALSIFVTAVFLVVDLSFFVANAVKVAQGGWFPILIGAAMFALMATWEKGRKVVAERLGKRMLPLKDFIQSLERGSVTRVPGTAIFFTADPESVPVALLHNLKHNRCLHARNVVLTIKSEDVPHIATRERLDVEPLGKEFYRVFMHYGFMEDPDVPRDLTLASRHGLSLDVPDLTYVLNRSSIVIPGRSGISRFWKGLFLMMSRNAARPNDYFRLPANRVIELGMEVEI
ncbi:MAG: potassium transporter Kup [Thermoanaerobaculia bacterium]